MDIDMDEEWYIETIYKYGHVMSCYSLTDTISPKKHMI
jgi:hypothetical protein